MKRKIKLCFSAILCIIATIQSINAYDVDPPSYVHQYLTNESGALWPLIPYEIKQHLTNSLSQNLDSNFDTGDDIISGSGEEDKPSKNVLEHFFQPDTPNNGRYDDGLFARISSYDMAKNLFIKNIIPLYLKGDINESYYWLGRVAHLLEDATVPAHVHLDCHLPPLAFGFPCGDIDALEDYTVNLSVFQSYKGSTYAGLQYNYESLPNIGSLNWNDVDASVSHKQYIELFRLFWYTAQKTQYYASNDVDGNTTYVRVTDGSRVQFSPSLWQNEIAPANIIFQQSQVQANVDKITNASLPHAMKAVAGLYRLFWEYAHTDWPTFHHNNQRTGFTILKGDMTSKTRVNKLNLVLEGNVSQGHIARASVMDIDNDGKQDVVIASSKLNNADDGIIFNSELSLTLLGYQMKKKWQFPVGDEVEAPPSLGNIDSDKPREVVFGIENGTLMALDVNNNVASMKWAFTVPLRYSVLLGGSIRGDLAFTALEDVDLDGKNEILFLEGEGTLPDWPGNIYILEDNGNSATWEANYTLGNGGGRGAPSLANIDSDDKPEIVVASYYGVYVFDYDNGVLTKKWSNTDGKITGAIAIADVDKDNNYELIYTTHTDTCHSSKTCFNKLYIRDALTGSDEGGSPIALAAVSRVTPAIGDIDNDGNVEIVINLEQGSGRIMCYEISGSACSGSWPYVAFSINLNTPSPDIADLDGDGSYDILFTTSNSNKIGSLSNKLGILNGNGNLKYEFDVGGEIGSAPAIADIDNDGVAEIAVKRAGSPINILTAVTDINEKPQFNITSNITTTGIAGSTLDLYANDKITAVDLDGDNLTIFYSPPYNTTGQWQTTVNDTGNYTSYVAISDGNLSDLIEITSIVFDNATRVATTFTDGSAQQSLNFTGSQTKTLQVRLPKDATIVYSRLKVGGRT